MLLIQTNLHHLCTDPNFVIASALDPRTKHLPWIKDKVNLQFLWDYIIDIMVQLKTSMETEDSTTSDSKPIGMKDVEPPVPCPPTKKKKTNPLSKFETRQDVQSTVTDAIVDPTNVKAACALELQQYRSAEGLRIIDEESQDFTDPLLWWKKRHSKFPTLWRMARFFLAIPATSALSERCFSAAKDIFTDQRAAVMKSSQATDHFLLKQSLKAAKESRKRQLD